MQGGLVRGMRRILSRLRPPLPVPISMTSLSVGGEGQARGGEMLLMLQVGSKALTLRGEEAGRFREVAGVSIVDAGGLRLQ